MIKFLIAKKKIRPVDCFLFSKLFANLLRKAMQNLVSYV